MRRLAAIALIAVLPALAADVPAPPQQPDAGFVVMPAAHYDRLIFTLKVAIERLEHLNNEIERQRIEIEQLKSGKYI